MVEALVLDLAPEPQSGEPPHAPGFKEGIMLWIGVKNDGVDSNCLSNSWPSFHSHACCLHG